MKSSFELVCARKRESAEKLVAEQIPDAIEMMCSFSHLDCIVDVKLEAGWQRYALIENDTAGDTLRRIG